MDDVLGWFLVIGTVAALIFAGIQAHENKTWMEKMVKSYSTPSEAQLNLVGSPERIKGMFTLERVENGTVHGSFVGEFPADSTERSYDCVNRDCTDGWYIRYTKPDGVIVRGNLPKTFYDDLWQVTVTLDNVSFDSEQ